MIVLPLNKRANVEQAAARDTRVNIVAFLLLIAPVAAGIWITAVTETPWGVIAGLLVGLTLMQSPKVAKQWERGVVLRLGRYVGLRGPGLFWVMPFIDSVNKWIDQRVITTSFAAEQTLTLDTV